MLAFGFLAGLVAATADRVIAGGEAAPLVASSPSAPLPPPLMAQGAGLAQALDGRRLELTLRGATVAVMAQAAPAENGCAALIRARTPGHTRGWTRLLRWSDLAWSGQTPDGRTLVAFYEPEGRLPADWAVFLPADAAAFRSALAGVAQECRSARGEAERVFAAANAHARSCYFAQLPGLHLVDSPVPAPLSDPPRAMLSVLARETPQAELQLLLKRSAPHPAARGEDWGRPEVAFSVAAPVLRGRRVVEAGFALDARPVAARYAIAAYGETRLRIIMDPFARPGAGPGEGVAVGQDRFFGALAQSGVVKMALRDEGGGEVTVLHFDAGPALAAARRALAAADWSCAAASPAPPSAARWQEGTIPDHLPVAQGWAITPERRGGQGE